MEEFYLQMIINDGIVRGKDFQYETFAWFLCRLSFERLLNYLINFHPINTKNQVNKLDSRAIHFKDLTRM